MKSLRQIILEGTKESLAVEYIKTLIQGSAFDNKVYIAGGAVRDELMGSPIKDIDLVVDIPDGGIKFADWATKKMGNYKPSSNPIVYPTYGTAKFNLRGVTYKGEDLSDIDIETVMPRSEEYTVGSRKPSVQGSSLKSDAERRDLTANSLFKNVSTGEIIDLTGKGKSDLEKGIARTPLDPYQTFTDDPLRMLRLIRFHVKYNWKIPLDTVKSLKKNSGQITNISSERIQDELGKILKTDNSGKAFKLLKYSGLASHIFPNLDISDEKIRAIQQSRKPVVKLAILFHDQSTEQIQSYLKAVKYPNDITTSVVSAVSLQKFFDESDSIQKIREFRRVAGKHASNALMLMDALNKSVDTDRIREVLDKLTHSPINAPISGKDLIDLGIKPGPNFKKILNVVQSKFEENPNTSREEYISIIKSMI